MPNIKYPLNKKLNRICDLRHAIGQFLEWVEKEKGLHLCESYKPQYAWYVPSHDSKEKLLLEFFGINLAELENEKRKMIAEHKGCVSETRTDSCCVQGGDLWQVTSKK